MRRSGAAEEYRISPAYPSEVRFGLCYSLTMEITVKIPDELAARAKARGLQVQAYVEEILAQQAESDPSGNGRFRTSEEIRAWLDSLAQFSDKIPPLPETISREWIYQDRD
jgi:post-segregation antitoxin (ccd killing protein)